MQKLRQKKAEKERYEKKSLNTTSIRTKTAISMKRLVKPSVRSICRDERH